MQKPVVTQKPLHNNIQIGGIHLYGIISTYVALNVFPNLFVNTLHIFNELLSLYLIATICMIDSTLVLQILDSFQDQSQRKVNLGAVKAILVQSRRSQLHPKLCSSEAALPTQLSHSTQDIQLYEFTSKYTL